MAQQSKVRKDKQLQEQMNNADVKKGLAYNLSILFKMPVVKARKVYSKKQIIKQMKRQQKMKELSEKQEQLSIILRINLAEGQHQQIKKMENRQILLSRVILIDTFRQIEEFININSSQSLKIRLIMSLVLEDLYFLFYLLKFSSFLDQKQAATFIHFLQGVCGMKKIAISHQVTLKLYSSVIKNVIKAIANNRQIKKTNKKTYSKAIEEIKRIENELSKEKEDKLLQKRPVQAEIRIQKFWTDEKERILMNKFIKDEGFKSMRQHFEKEYPKLTPYFKLDYLRKKVFDLIRRQVIQIYNISLRIKNKSIPILTDISTGTMNRILQSRDTLDLRLKIAQLSLQRQISVDQMRQIVTEINRLAKIDYQQNKTKFYRLREWKEYYEQDERIRVEQIFMNYQKKLKEDDRDQYVISSDDED